MAVLRVLSVRVYRMRDMTSVQMVQVGPSPDSTAVDTEEGVLAGDYT